MSVTRRLIAVLVSMVFLSPSLALAQAPKAGVVTTLEGNVTARRVALPAPVPLKFKDDVFLQDTVTTGDKALARMLLGGKAVVTVRERSVLTITEMPGKSTIDLESGKFALAVAREKMRPGEEILIRTPNAIAGVRGTVVVTEVTRQGAQAGAGAPAVLTNFYVLRGSIFAQQLDPSTRQPTGTPLQVGTLQAYSQAGAGAPRVAPVPAGQVGQITSGLQPSGPKGGSDAGQEQVKAQALQTAVSLVAALTGGGETQVAFLTAPSGVKALPSTLPSTGPSQTAAPITPPVAEAAQEQREQQAQNPQPPSNGSGGEGQPPEQQPAPEQPATPEPPVVVEPPPLTPPIVLSGTTVRTETTPLLELDGETVTSTGGQPLILVAPGADVTLASPLARIRNSSITGDGSGLDIRGKIRSTDQSPFVDIDPTQVTVLGNMFSVVGVGAELRLAGPLLRDVGGTFLNGGTETRSFFVISDGGLVQGTSPEPFISLTNSTVFSLGSLLSNRRSGTLPSTMELAGPFLEASGAFIAALSTTLRDQAGNPRLCCSFFSVGEGARFTSTTPSPLVSLAETGLITGQHVFSVFDTTSIFGESPITLPGAVMLAGPLVNATSNTIISGLSDFLGIFRSTLTSTTTAPLITLEDTGVVMGGTSPIDGSTVAGRMLNLSANASLPATLALNGPLLTSTDSTIITTNDVFEVFAGASLTSTTTSPLIAVEGGSITAGENSFFRASSGTAAGPQVTLAGPLLSASNSTITTGDDVFGFFNGASLTSTTSSPLLTFTSSTVNGLGQFVHVNGLTLGGSPTSLTLAGPLLGATNSTIVQRSNLLRIAEGASVSSTTTSPLVSITGGSFTGGGPVNTASGGSLLRMFSQVGRPGSTLTLAGPFADIVNATITTTDADTFNLADGSTITSTTTSPFASFTSSAVTSAFSFFDLQTNTSFGTPVTVGSGAPATMSLARSLIDAVDTTFTVQNGDFFRMRNGVSLTQSGPSPLLRLTGTNVGDVSARPSSNFVELSSNQPASPQLSLEGQFLVAKNAVLTSGDPTQNAFSFFFIGDGAQVTSSTGLPFLSFDSSSVDTSGNVLDLRRSRANTPSRLTLAGPLLSATNSTFNYTSLGFGSACCSMFFIAQGAELASTTTDALIQLTNSTVTGADSQSGGNFFLMSDTRGGAPATELVAPAKVTLAGPLFRATNSTIASLFGLVSVNRSMLTSTTTVPLITLTGGTLALGGIDPFGTVPFSSILGVTSSGASPASVLLAGPFLSASGSTIAGSGSFINVVNLANGATLTSTTTQPLIELSGTTLTTSSPQFVNTGFSVFSAQTCPASGCTGINPDGTFATMNLQGPLLSASNGSSVNTTSALVFVSNGGQLIVNGSTDPLISLTGGTHAIDSVGIPFFTSAVFDLRGRSTATAPETVDLVLLTLGTDKPIQHGGGLLEASGATITSQQTVRLDTALLEASAPLLHLKSGSSLTTATNAVDLVQKVKLTSVGPVFKLDGSALTVNSGALVLVGNGSLFKVTGDFLQLSNGSTLSLLNGPVLSVTNNSVVNISGAFVNFGGTGGNLISVTNNLCSTAPGCTSIGGLNVKLNGTPPSNVSITNPIKNGGPGGLGSFNLSNGANTAVISVSGATTKVTISGN